MYIYIYMCFITSQKFYKSSILTPSHPRPTNASDLEEPCGCNRRKASSAASQMATAQLVGRPPVFFMV